MCFEREALLDVGFVDRGQQERLLSTSLVKSCEGKVRASNGKQRRATTEPDRKQEREVVKSREKILTVAILKADPRDVVVVQSKTSDEVDSRDRRAQATGDRR